MLRGVARAAVFASLTLALWVLARPAHAMPAGLCDDRGASAIAPPPALEPPESALSRTRAAAAPVPCPGDDVPAGVAVQRSHRVSADPGSAIDGVLPTHAPAVAAAMGTELERAPVKTPNGVEMRFRVERPPRG